MKKYDDKIIDKNNSSIRILIVDDSQSSKDLLADLLLKNGYTIRVASNGLEAINLLENEEVDLVLTDLKMPGANGIDVLRKAIQLHPDILVAIITGYASLDSAMESVREGAFDYIKKPFGLHEILVLVRKAAERIHLIKENKFLFERLRETREEIKSLLIKKESFEKKIKSMNNKLELLQGRLAHQVLSVKKFPSNLLPYQNPNDLKGKTRATLEQLDQLSLLMREGMIDEREFKALKKRILSAH